MTTSIVNEREWRTELISIIVHFITRQHIIGTPAVRQAVLRLAWYIRPIRFEDSIRKRIGRPIRFEIRFEREKKRFAGPYYIIDHIDVLNNCLTTKFIASVLTVKDRLWRQFLRSYGSCMVVGLIRKQLFEYVVHDLYNYCWRDCRRCCR